MAREDVLMTGSLDLDSDLTIIKDGSVIDALNVNRISHNGNSSFLRNTLNGNRPFVDPTYTLPAGMNKTMGVYVDREKNRIIDFLYNSNGSNQIRIWDLSAKRIRVIIEDNTAQTGGDAILAFNPNSPITSIDILHRNPVYGDLLSWCCTYDRPKQINIDKTLAATGFYAILDYEDILQIRKAPLTPPSSAYQNDTTRSSNALRNFLFQFSYRYIYDDFSVSTYAPLSKVALPQGSADPSIDVNPTNNNYIALSLETPPNLVTKIEIIARQSEGQSGWSDPFLVKTILLNNPLTSPPIFNFYGDGSYPPVDVQDFLLSYTFLPDIAEAQCFINGNVRLYGCITEGQDYSSVVPNITMSTSLEDVKSSKAGITTPIKVSEIQMTWSLFNSNSVQFTAKYIGSGQITGNCVVSFTAAIRHHGSFNSSHWSYYNSSITLTAGSETNSVVIDSGSQVDQGAYNASAISVNGNEINAQTDFFSIAKYDWLGQYKFGLIYKDDFNKTNTVYTEDALSIFMPDFSFYTDNQGGSVIQAPVISASINHLPPSWATSFDWVRTKRVNYSFVQYWAALNVLVDQKYLYIDISNLTYYFNNCNQSTNQKYDFAPGDKVKILYYPALGSGKEFSYIQKEMTVIGMPVNPPIGNTSALTGFQITNPGWGYVTAPTVNITGGGGSGAKAHAVLVNGTVVNIVLDEGGTGYTSVPTITFSGGGGTNAAAVAISGYFAGTFLKFNLDTDTYPQGTCYIKIFRPAVKFAKEDTVYFEFGEHYPILTDGSGNRYHGGSVQNQTATQPATFTFREGDVFLTNLNIPNSVTNQPVTFFPWTPFMSMSFDDNFLAGQNSNGRAFSEFINAKRLRYPALYRFSGQIIDNTQLNRLSLVNDNDKDQFDESYGAIRRFVQRQNFVRVFQERKVGRVPVLSRIITNADGSQSLIEADTLMNRIQYEVSIYGIGDAPASLVSNNNADYFTDTNMGVVARASNDGVDAISILNKTNSLFANILAGYNYTMIGETSPNPSVPNALNPQITGFLNTFTNEYVLCMSSVDRWLNNTPFIQQNAMTIGYSQNYDGFESKYSFTPEFGCSINGKMFTFYGGMAYSHDNPIQNNFYGVQYDSYVQVVANQNILEDKGYLSLKETATAIWYCDLITTSLGQSSNIPLSSFSLLEGNPSAAFLRSINEGGLIVGTPLKGKYVVIRFRITTTTPQSIGAVSIETKD